MNLGLRSPHKLIGPDGRACTIHQLEQGEITLPGDWFLVLGHMKTDWYTAEPNLKIRAFHQPHVRILRTESI